MAFMDVKGAIFQLRRSNHAKGMDHYVATTRKHEPKLSRSYILERWDKSNADRN